MNIEVWIAPHERSEALEAYRQWLSVEQENAINEAPEEVFICLRISSGKTTVITASSPTPRRTHTS